RFAAAVEPGARLRDARPDRPRTTGLAWVGPGRRWSTSHRSWDRPIRPSDAACRDRARRGPDAHGRAHPPEGGLSTRVGIGPDERAIAADQDARPGRPTRTPDQGDRLSRFRARQVR